MNRSRRNLCLLLPTLFAARSSRAADEILPSKAYRFAELPVHGASRPVMTGETHSGFPIEVHETDLAPGTMPHPPHRHIHEEMFLIREGTLAVTINGQTSRIGPGSVAYIASNDLHGIRNVGEEHAQYFVVAFGARPVSPRDSGSPVAAASGCRHFGTEGLRMFCEAQ